MSFRGRGSRANHRGYGGSNRRGSYRGHRGNYRGTGRNVLHEQPPPSATNSIDITRQLQMMTTTLADLARRLGQMETSNRHESTSAARQPPMPVLQTANTVVQPNRRMQTDHQPAAQTSRPAQVRSHNSDFPKLTKCLYRLSQLEHHSGNWLSLPKSIDGRLKKLVDDINPPMVDETFKRELRTAVNELGDRIVQLVERHIIKKTEETKSEAAGLDRTDIDRATDIASKYLDTRLGKRLDLTRRKALLQSAAAAVGTAPIHSATPSKSTTDWITVTGNGRRAEKRGPTGQNSTPTNNRYAVLDGNADQNDDDDAMSDVQPLSPRIIQSARKKSRTATATSKTPPPPAPSTSNTTQSHKTPPSPRSTGYDRLQQASSNVIIHRRSRDEWIVTPDTVINNIIVGDSNLRQIDMSPPGWQAFCLPGAHISDVTRALSQLGQHDGRIRKYIVVIQAGINHRSCYDDKVEHEIDQLVTMLRQNERVERIYHVGVPHTPCMTATERENIDHLNTKFRQVLQEGCCIPPMNDDDVEVSPTDIHGIHYTELTAQAMMDSVTRAVNLSDFH